MSLLEKVTSVLEARGIPYALIGASAMSYYGVNRATNDLDLLAVDPACLDPALWSGLRDQGVTADVRRGDLTDPLAGVVRFRAAAERPIDLVVGKFAWQRKTLERARRLPSGPLFLPVLGPADLILLKLYAGGPQDAWDIQQFLLGEDRDTLIAEVEKNLANVPSRCGDLWRKILDG